MIVNAIDIIMHYDKEFMIVTQDRVYYTPDDECDWDSYSPIASQSLSALRMRKYLYHWGWVRYDS